MCSNSASHWKHFSMYSAWWYGSSKKVVRTDGEIVREKTFLSFFLACVWMTRPTGRAAELSMDKSSWQSSREIYPDINTISQKHSFIPMATENSGKHDVLVMGLLEIILIILLSVCLLMWEKHSISLSTQLLNICLCCKCLKRMAAVDWLSVIIGYWWIIVVSICLLWSPIVYIHTIHTYM